jgi:hypothetical protein
MIEIGSLTYEAEQCPYCDTWWNMKNDALKVHVLISHPETEEAELLLLLREPKRVPRDW